MGAMSRRKGANYEREVVNILKRSGHPAARNLDQTRDGGGDIPFGDFLIECKRRKSMAIYDWMDQCIYACRDSQKPMLAIRADQRISLVVLTLDDFLELISRTPPSTQGRAPQQPSL